MTHINGQALPKVRDEEATDLEVWRYDDGVALTMAFSNGRIITGLHISYADWMCIVTDIGKQFATPRKKK